MDDGTTAISTETQTAVSIVIDHLKISPWISIEKNDSVSANAEASMTQLGNLFVGESMLLIPIIHEEKIISSRLVFVEVNNAHAGCWVLGSGVELSRMTE